MWIIAALSAAYAQPRPADLEGWLPQLTRAVRRGDAAVLEAVFAEPLAVAAARGQSPPLEAVASELKRRLRGRPSVVCRGEVCQAQYPSGDETWSLRFHRVDGRWVVWDPEAGEHVPGQVSAQLTVEGPGAVRVHVNGAPTFLLEDVADGTAAVSMLDRALVPGRNEISLIPLAAGAATVSLRVGYTPPEAEVVDTTTSDLVSYDGPLDAPRAWSFEVPPPR